MVKAFVFLCTVYSAYYLPFIYVVFFCFPKHCEYCTFFYDCSQESFEQ